MDDHFTAYPKTAAVMTGLIWAAIALPVLVFGHDPVLKVFGGLILISIAIGYWKRWA